MLKKYSFLIILLLVGAYLSLTPSLHFSYIPGSELYNEKRQLQIVLLLFLSIFLLISKKYTSEALALFSSIPYYIRLLLVLFAGIGIVASLFSEFPVWAFLEVGHLFLLFAGMVLVGGIVSVNKNTIGIIKFIVLLTVSLYLLRVGISYGLHLAGDYPLWPGDRFTVGMFGFSNLRFFNQIQTFTLPLLTVFVWMEGMKENQIQKWGLFMLTSLWWMLVFASSAMGAFVSVIVSFLVLLFFFDLKRIKTIIKVQVFSLIAASACYFLFFNLIPARGDGGQIIASSGTKRLDVWSDLIVKNLENPLFGYGPMHYSIVNDMISFPAHPHNWFLQFSYEWGIAGGLILGFVIFIGLYKAITKSSENFKKNEKESLDLTFLEFGLVWALFAAVTHGLISGIFVMPMSQIWLMLTGGVLLGIMLKPDNDVVSRKNRVILRLFILGSFIGLGYWFFAYDLEEQKVKFRESQYTSNKISPRYWHQGKIGFEEELEEKDLDKPDMFNK